MLIKNVTEESRTFPNDEFLKSVNANIKKTVIV